MTLTREEQLEMALYQEQVAHAETKRQAFMMILAARYGVKGKYSILPDGTIQEDDALPSQ